MEWLGCFCITLSRKEIEEPHECYIVGDTQALFGDLYYVTNRPFQTLNFQNLKLMDQVFCLFVFSFVKSRKNLRPWRSSYSDSSLTHAKIP